MGGYLPCHPSDPTHRRSRDGHLLSRLSNYTSLRAFSTGGLSVHHFTHGMLPSSLFDYSLRTATLETLIYLPLIDK